MKILTIVSLVTMFVLLPGIAVSAHQGPDSGSISGKVLTVAGNGTPVSKAPVAATNLDTKQTYNTTSASDGGYTLNGLTAGHYEIAIERFAMFVRFHQSIEVAARKTTRLDIRLDDRTLNTLGDGGELFAGVIADKPAPSGLTPRSSEGTPDLSGIWQHSLPSLVGESPEALPGKKPTTASGLGPGPLCLPLGFSAMGEIQIVQTSALVVLLDGGFNPTRLIYLDGRSHPADFNPSWMGHSIGHWEADTLVVETVGFNELGKLGGVFSGFPGNVVPQTEKLRVTERFRRPDLGHLEVETTYDDPSAFRKPFTIRNVKSLALKNWEILEYVCEENERDLPHLPSGNGR